MSAGVVIRQISLIFTRDILTKEVKCSEYSWFCQIICVNYSNDCNQCLKAWLFVLQCHRELCIDAVVQMASGRETTVGMCGGIRASVRRKKRSHPRRYSTCPQRFICSIHKSLALLRLLFISPVCCTSKYSQNKILLAFDAQMAGPYTALKQSWTIHIEWNIIHSSHLIVGWTICILFSTMHQFHIVLKGEWCLLVLLLFVFTFAFCFTVSHPPYRS